MIPTVSNTQMTRRQSLMITAGAAFIVYLIWNISALAFIAYPVRLFVTYVHEAGHSSMALLTGGEVHGFQVYSDGSGVAATSGGERLLILPAGYLGAAVFGAVLFYLLNVTRRARSIAVAVGIGLLIFSALYAIPLEGLPLALFVGVISGFLLIALGLKASVGLCFLVLNVLAIMTALNAVLDLVALVSHAEITMPTSDGSGVIRNDAYAFAEHIGFLPATVWAFVWAGLALLIVGASIYYSLIRPMLRQEPEGTARTPRLSLFKR